MHDATEMPAFRNLLLFLCLNSVGLSEILQSANGREIKVNILRKNATHVWFNPIGKTKEMSYEISKLSESSQTYLQTWEPPKSHTFKVDYSSGKRNQAAGYEDRAYRMKPEITLKNGDQKNETPSVKAHLFVFGKPIKYRRTLCLIHKEAFDVPSLQPLKETTVTTKKEIHFQYDDRGIVHGARYKGYLLVLTDSEGKEIFRKSVPETAYDAPLESIQKMGIAQVYTNEMQAQDQKVYLK